MSGRLPLAPFDRSAQRLSRIARPALALISLLLLPAIVANPASAATKTWASGVSGNWSDGSKWGGSAPQAGDVVLITAAGTYTVTLDVDASIDSLVLGDGTGTQTLTSTSHTLSTAGPSRIRAGAELFLSASTVNGAGTLVNQGTITMIGSSSITRPTSNGGTIVARNQPNTISGTLVSLVGSTIRVDGNGAVDHNLLTVSNGFTNHGTIDLINNGSSGLEHRFAVTSGTLTNASDGIIQSRPGPFSAGSRQLTASLANAGSVNATFPLTIDKASGTHSNSNAISITAGGGITVTSNGSFTNTGTITFGGAQTMSVSGGTFTYDPGTTSGASGTLMLTSCNANGTMTLTGTSARVLVSGGVIVDNLTNTGGLLVARNQPNTITTVAGNTGTLRVDGEGAVDHDLLTVTNGFTNHGTVDLINNGSSALEHRFAVTTGLLTNASDGIVKSRPGPFSAGSRQLSASLVNTGLLDVTFPLTIDKTSGAHANSNAISITGSGSIAVTNNGAFANTGTITFGASQTMSVNGGTFTYDPGTTSGASGTLLFTNCNANGTMTLTGTSARVLVSGGVTVDQLTNTGGLLVARNQPNTITTVVSNTGTLRVDGNGAVDHDALTVTNGFTNHGTIELENAGSSALEHRFTVTSGTLTNASDGVIQSRPGAFSAGSRQLTASLANAGTLDVTFPLTMDKAFATYSSSNTIAITGSGSITVLNNGSFTNTGAINFGGSQTMSVTGGTFTYDPGTTTGTSGTLQLTNCTANGTMTLTASSARVLVSGGVTVDHLTNTGGLLVARNQPNTITTVASNTGTLRVDGNGAVDHDLLTVTNGFTNHGTIELENAGSSALEHRFAVTSGALTNASDGVVRSRPGAFSAGTRQLTASLANAGLVDVTFPLTIDKVSGAHSNSNAISITGPGSIAVTNNGSFTNTGTITFGASQTMSISGGTFDYDPGTTSGASGTLLLANCTVPGTMTLTASSARVLVSGGVTVNSLTNNGGLFVARNQPNTITTVAGNTGTLRVDGNGAVDHGLLTVTNGFTNHGTIELENAGSSALEHRFAVNGLLTNASDGIIKIRAGAFSAGTRQLTASLANQGLLDVTFPLAIDGPSGAHSNSNIIAIAGTGRITITNNSSFVHTGSITFDAAQLMSVSGGTFSYDPGTTSGAAGTLELANCNAVGSMTLTASSARVLVSGNVTVSNLANNGGLFVARNQPNTITNVLGNTGTLGMDGNGGVDHGLLTVTNGFTNHGTIQLENTGSSGLDHRFVVANGQLVNATDATIRSLPGPFNAGARQFKANVLNQGLMLVSHPLLMETGPLANAPVGTIRGTSTLNVSGVTFTNDGITQPGASPGQLTIQGDDPRSSTSALDIELGAFTPTPSFDRLVVNGTATLNGAMNIHLVNGYTPVLGDSFTVVLATTRDDTFPIVSGRTISPTLAWVVKYRTGRVDLIAGTPPPNNSPNAVNDNATVGEDLSIDIDVRANDSDPDQNHIDVVPGGFSTPAHGSVSINPDSTAHYVPAPDYYGSDSFTYRIVDSLGAEDTATVLVTVTPINDPPAFYSPTAAESLHIDFTSSDPVSFNVCSGDPDFPNGVVQLTAVGLPAGATMTPSLPVSGNPACSHFDWTPAAEQKGQTFTVYFVAVDDSSTRDTLRVILDLDQVSPVLLSRLVATPTEDGVDLSWEILSGIADWTTEVQRSEREVGPWERVDAERSHVGSVEHALDRSAMRDRDSFYRLRLTNNSDGQVTTFGPVRASFLGAINDFTLGTSPNPSRGPVTFAFALPRSTPVRIAVIDLLGREVVRLQDGDLTAGRYQLRWSGNEGGYRPAMGIYFVRMSGPGFQRVQRFAIMR